MAGVQSAFSLMMDLRSILDKRLSENEDYRALKALDKAILEVKILSEVAADERMRSEKANAMHVNPVADAQNQIAVRLTS